MKKIFNVLLGFTLVLFAYFTISSSKNNSSVEQQQTYSTPFQTTISTSSAELGNDVLKPYISVHNGLFVLDQESALNAGLPQDLVEGQQVYFKEINSLAVEGVVKIFPDLTVLTSEAVKEISLAYGYSSSWKLHWWGISKYMNSDETKIFRQALFYVDIAFQILAGISNATAHKIISIVFELGGVYAKMMSNSLSNVDKGRGVHFAIRWFLYYTIESQ